MRLFKQFFSVTMLLMAGIGSSTVLAQDAQERSSDRLGGDTFGSGLGMNVLLSNNGFGIGGYYQRAISNVTSLHIELEFAPVKDENEQKFFGWLGETIIPGKYKYFMAMPLHAGVQRRMFRNKIEDNFRPFIQVIGGPTVGWAWPYFDDRNNNRMLDPDERTYDIFSSLFRGSGKFGFGATLAFGAHFGSDRRSTQGLRIGYSFNYFMQEVQLMEPHRKDAQRFFGTPTITFFFGRLN